MIGILRFDNQYGFLYFFIDRQQYWKFDRDINTLVMYMVNEEYPQAKLLAADLMGKIGEVIAYLVGEELSRGHSAFEGDLTSINVIGGGGGGGGGGRGVQSHPVYLLFGAVYWS